MTEPVLLAQKTLHSGQAHGHLAGGGGIIPLEYGYALKIIKLNAQFIQFNLLHYGKGVTVPSQTYQRAAKVVRPPKVVQPKKQVRTTEAKIEFKQQVEQEQLI